MANGSAYESTSMKKKELPWFNFPLEKPDIVQIVLKGPLQRFLTEKTT